MDSNGLPTQDGIHEAKVFQEHFCKITNGVIVPFEQLVHKDRCGDDSRFDGLTSEGIWHILPTVSDIHHRYLKMKNDKILVEIRKKRCFSRVGMLRTRVLCILSYFTCS